MGCQSGHDQHSAASGTEYDCVIMDLNQFTVPGFVYRSLRMCVPGLDRGRLCRLL